MDADAAAHVHVAREPVGDGPDCLQQEPCQPFILTKKKVLSLTHNEVHYSNAIKLKKVEDIYDLSSDKFGILVSKLIRRVNEFYLNQDNNFSDSKTVGGTAVFQKITACYGELDRANLRTQAEGMWLYANGDI